MSLDILLQNFKPQALNYTAGIEPGGALDKNQTSSHKGLQEGVVNSPQPSNIPDLFDTKALLRDLQGKKEVTSEEAKQDYRKSIVEGVLKAMGNRLL